MRATRQSGEQTRRSTSSPTRYVAGAVIAGLFLAGCSTKTESADGALAPPAAAVPGTTAPEVPLVQKSSPSPEATKTSSAAKKAVGGVACKGYTWEVKLVNTFSFNEIRPDIAVNNGSTDYYAVVSLWPSAEAAKAANGKASEMGGVVAAKQSRIIQAPDISQVHAVTLSVVDFSPLPVKTRPTHPWEITMPLDPKFAGATISPCEQGGSNIIDFDQGTAG